MKKVVIAFILGAAMLIPTIVPMISNNITAEAASFTMARIEKNNVRVRKGPGTDTAAYGQVNKGETFKVLGRTKGHDGKMWIKIQYNRQGIAEGWVRSDMLNEHTIYR